MNEVLIKIGITILGLVTISILLKRFNTKKTPDTSFMKEYLDVLNNPIYKIKKE